MSNSFYTRSILWRLGVVLSALVGVLIWQRGFLYTIYFKDQLTSVGWVINGAIIVLFLVGLFKLVVLFYRYIKEEAHINQFVTNIERGIEPPEYIDPDSMMVSRYYMLQELHARRARINQSALAASLVATESSLLSFPKFANNVLILGGVFGTIVSLSIALIGASDMLGGSTEIGGLSTVIHGMSTALSTTMTAIVCYFFFGYFYLKLVDTQTHIISRIEQITATSLMPHFQAEEETVLQDFGEVVKSAHALIATMTDNHERLTQTTELLKELVADTQNKLIDADHRFAELNELLREGFRLPEKKQ